jgi:hypothetical protein
MSLDVVMMLGNLVASRGHSGGHHSLGEVSESVGDRGDGPSMSLLNRIRSQVDQLTTKSCAARDLGDNTDCWEKESNLLYRGYFHYMLDPMLMDNDGERYLYFCHESCFHRYNRERDRRRALRK